MKYLKYFLVAGVMFISLSSTTSKVTKPSEGIYPGNLLPDIKNLTNASGATINLSDLKGQKVLVNLWAAYDAQSRKENALLSNKIEKEDYSVKMVSVSFDKSRSVFEKTVTLDKIEDNMQFWIDDNAQTELSNLHRLNKGFKSYLIDENGKIIAVNLNSENLDQYLIRN